MLGGFYANFLAVSLVIIKEFAMSNDGVVHSRIRDWTVKTQNFENRSWLRSTVATAVLGVAMISTPSFAQDADDDAVTADIVVTGSRIPQPNLEGASPVTTVTSEEVKIQGVVRVEDLLNKLPQVFAGQASTLSNGSDGTATVDLRGLGAARTLVLINGRRLMPGDPVSTTAAADLNAIPEALVQRVEVLTGGASSTYGADAVAGVVNFIMDTKFEGVRLDAQYSFYQHNNRNKVTPPILDARQRAGFSGFDYPTGSGIDGAAFSTSVTMGSSFADDRGHATAYFGYRKVKPVTQNNRDYSACTIQNTAAGALQCGGSLTGAPGHVIVYDTTTSGVTSTVFQFLPGRTIAPGVNRYNFAPTNYFQRPDERYTAGVFLDYEISDSIKPYMEFMFMDDRSIAQIAPSGNFGNTLTINCDNPLLSAQQRGIVCDADNLITGFLGTFPLVASRNTANPAAGPVAFIDPVTGATYNKAFFQPLRRNVEGGPRRADLQHTQYRAVLGAKGDLGKGFSYDAYYQYGRTVYAQTYSNELSIARLTRALDVVAGPGGAPICRSARTGEDPNCVPYDILSGGTVSQSALSYLAAEGLQRGVVSQQIASASITGLLGEHGLTMPWTDKGVAMNVGVEYRKDSLELQTDNAFQTGDLSGQGAPTLPISGSYNVKEIFGEVQVPVVSDGFIHDLSFDAGYRHSNYKTSSGGSFSTNTYKFGVEFAPVADLRFRGTYNRAVRAPNIQELFATQYIGLGGSSDPCAELNRAITAADVGCLAQGLRVGQTVASNPAGQYNARLGGNVNLQPERATTKTLGVIFQPSFIKRLALTVDYFDVKVKQAIQGFGADAIVNTCFSTQNPTACGLINRNPVTGSLWLTSDGFTVDLPRNIGGVATKGIDVNGSYSLPLGDGKLGLNVVGTYLDKYEVDNGLQAPYDCAGLYGVTCGVPAPKWRHQTRLSYNTDSGVGLSVAWRYFNSVKVDLTSSNPALNGNGSEKNPGIKIPSQSYFDVAGSIQIADKYTLRLGVNNVLDRQPPLVTSGSAATGGNACPTGPCNGNTYPAVYDALGRYVFAGVTLDF